MAMFPVIEASGSAFERGRIHGSQARGRVESSLANYARLFEFNGMPWQEALRRAMPFREVIGNFNASLLEEIDGIAQGAGRSAGEILALNARTELLPAQVLSGADNGECTAIAVSPGGSATGGTLLAQNWDWVGSQRESMILLRVREDDGAGFLTLTEAGMLAKIGMNSSGFGVCLNILRSKFDGERPGLPVHVFLRALLERPGTRDAIAFACALAFGSSSNVLCGDRSGDTASLEVSPRGVQVVRGEGATLCHTNHFLAPDAAGWQATLLSSLSTVPRLERARQHAASKPKNGIEDLKRLLRDESAGYLSICRAPDPALPPDAQIESVASVIMELSRGVMHVAPDLPTRSEYQPVSLAGEAALA
jgi:isopenicillin-N N-acyltransferase-like protein